MNSTDFCFFFVFCFVGVESSVDKSDHRAIFDQFKQRHGKNYSAAEDQQRFHLFNKTLHTIGDHNARFDRGEVTYKLGVNDKADWVVWWGNSGLGNALHTEKWCNVSETPDEKRKILTQKPTPEEKRRKMKHYVPSHQKRSIGDEIIRHRSTVRHRHHSASTTSSPVAKRDIEPGRWHSTSTAAWTQTSPQTSTQSSSTDTVDWRNKGVVGPVRNQGSCGDCWAFGAAGAIQSQLAINGGALQTLSVQQLCDCMKSWDSSTYGSDHDGCGGGWPHDAYAYVMANGIELDSAYPDVGYTQWTCQANKALSMFPFAQQNVATGYTTKGDESALVDAVKNVGPITVTINGECNAFAYYTSGILKNTGCSTSINHVVLLIGYGTDVVNGESVPYYLIQNSWGTTWGNGGYGKIARNQNELGIASYGGEYPLIHG